jgi:hypothetical protein
MILRQAKPAAQVEPLVEVDSKLGDNEGSWSPGFEMADFLGNFEG